jgi:hypothetical protein
MCTDLHLRTVALALRPETLALLLPPNLALAVAVPSSMTMTMVLLIPMIREKAGLQVMNKGNNTP